MADNQPKHVQGLLGHAGKSTPLGTFSHVIESMNGGLADAAEEAL